MNIDAVTLLNAIGKYVDESNIENFLKDINFNNLADYRDIEELLEDLTILSNKKGIIVLKAISIKDLDGYFEDIDFSDVDPTVLKLIESKIDNEITENNIDIIDQILNSNLVDFNNEFSIEDGYFSNPSTVVTSNSKLSNELCLKLIRIYIKEHEWKGNQAGFYFKDFNSYYAYWIGQIGYTEFNESIIDTIGEECLYILEDLGYDISDIDSSTTFNNIDIDYRDYLKLSWEVFYIKCID